MLPNRRYDESSPQPSSYSHEPARSAELAREPRLSLLEGLLIPSLEDYAACERYCRSNPDIWEEDVSELKRMTCRYLDESRNEHARRCAERWLMVSTVKRGKLKPGAGNAFLRGLSKDDTAFRTNLDKIISEWGQEEIDPRPSAATGSTQPAQQTQKPLKHTTERKSSTTNAPDLTEGVKAMNLTKPTAGTLGQRNEPTYTMLPPPVPSPTQINKRRSGSFRRGSRRTSNPAREDEEPAEVETVYADTLDDMTLQEEGISNETLGVGPELSSMPAYKEKNDLYDSYKLRLGREAEEFFVKGRVLAIVWHENTGSSTHPKSTENSAQWDRPFHRYTRTRDGVDIFSHIRRFVVVKTKAKRRYCLAVPINSYGNQGLAKVGMRMEEKQAHTVIYARGTKPTRLVGEVELDKEPIEVEMAANETLTPASRIHFGKLQTIEWNVRVKDVGLVRRQDAMRRLINYFKQEHGFDQEYDTSTEKEKQKNRA